MKVLSGTMKDNLLKEKCEECRGSGCNTLVKETLCFLIKPELVEKSCESCNGKNSCPNCEDGWVWKFSKIKNCICVIQGKVVNGNSEIVNCDNCNGTGVITEPVKDGEIELKYANYYKKNRLIGAWDLKKELLDDGWRLE